jgi:hypothetical protein
MISLFQQIADTQKLPGWCSLEKANTLASIVIALRPDISIESGVFAGRSFLPIALAHKQIGHGMAYGIEPWSKEAACEGYTGENKEWWGHLDIDAIKEQFMGYYGTLGIQNVSRIVQKRFQDFEIPNGVGLFHLDSQHTDQSIEDLTRVIPNLHLGGLIVLDDLHWLNDGVASVGKAVRFLERQGFRKLYEVYNKPKGTDDWAVFQRLE